MRQLSLLEGLIRFRFTVLPGALIVCAVFFLAAAPDAPGVRFSDVTAAAGIHFVHNAGKSGKKYLPETMGSGVAAIDLYGDGWPSLLFVNSRPWGAHAGKSLCALYRNNHNGTFTDITAGSGLDVEMYGMGAAVADYDNDGLDDVYITAIDGDHLFHNEGNGRFRDVTKAAGIHNADFGTSAAWFDYDRDGKPDLFVANYVTWSEKGDLWCSMDGTHKSYCTPQSYKGTSSRLYHNLGNGRFEDVTEKAGLADASSKSLGVAVLDIDNDGWPDLFIANDTEANNLYRNNRNGTFSEVGVSAGVAFGEDGVARGGMGTDAGDYDHSGRFDILVGNFSNQMAGLYHNEGGGLFTDVAPRSPVGRDSLLDNMFGALFFDYDLDGWPDIFIANGHIDEDIGRAQPKIQFREAPLLFHNAGRGAFENASGSIGPDLERPIVARGAAYLDYDHDGDLDLVVTTNDGPAYLFRNDGGNRNHWLTLKLVGTKSNRSALGAVVHVDSALGGQMQMVHSGSSYCSQSDLALTFGLGRDDVAKKIVIYWPSGRVDTLYNVRANQFKVVKEGS